MASTNTRLNPMRPGYTRPKAVSSLGRPPAGAACTDWRMPNRRNGRASRVGVFWRAR